MTLYHLYYCKYWESGAESEYGYTSGWGNLSGFFLTISIAFQQVFQACGKTPLLTIQTWKTEDSFFPRSALFSCKYRALKFQFSVVLQHKAENILIENPQVLLIDINTVAM